MGVALGGSVSADAGAHLDFVPVAPAFFAGALLVAVVPVTRFAGRRACM
jgi:hypothetical protein